MNCGISCRRGLDLALLWLWCRPVAMALIWPLAWEPPSVTGVALNPPPKFFFKKIQIGSVNVSTETVTVIKHSHLKKQPRCVSHTWNGWELCHLQYLIYSHGRKKIPKKPRQPFLAGGLWTLFLATVALSSLLSLTYLLNKKLPISFFLKNFYWFTILC